MGHLSVDGPNQKESEWNIMSAIDQEKKKSGPNSQTHIRPGREPEQRQIPMVNAPQCNSRVTRPTPSARPVAAGLLSGLATINRYSINPNDSERVPSPLRKVYSKSRPAPQIGLPSSRTRPSWSTSPTFIIHPSYIANTYLALRRGAEVRPPSSSARRRGSRADPCIRRRSSPRRQPSPRRHHRRGIITSAAPDVDVSGTSPPHPPRSTLPPTPIRPPPRRAPPPPPPPQVPPLPLRQSHCRGPG